MGDCNDRMRNCKRTAGIAGTVRSKRRRIVGLEMDSENAVAPAKSGGADLCSSFCTDQFPASCCSSNELSDVGRNSFRLADLELQAQSFETVDSTFMNNNKFSRETTPSSELCGDSEELMNSPAASHRQIFPASKMPPKAEIEEFFAMAEKYEQKRFAEKYNYDIVNDVPLEGRYQWIRLKP